MKQAEVKEWVFIKEFKAENGAIFLYDKGVGFRSGMKVIGVKEGDEFTGCEFFSFSEGDKSFIGVQDSYICIKKGFIDYKVVIIGDKIFILFLYPNSVIKPIEIRGCHCGDISVTKIKNEEFHIVSGHAIIRNKKIETIKDFSGEINEYTFKSFTS